jgi:hypothetical protein
MKRIIVIFFLTVCLTAFADAQDYNTGVGLRGGYASGITVKHFIGRNAALEGLLTSRWQGFEITGLYEVHGMAFDVDRLNWYYGGGAHLGSFDASNVPWGTSGIVVGIDGVIGIEYNFTEAPISVGIDWKPSINILGYSEFRGDEAALSVRYIF